MFHPFLPPIPWPVPPGSHIIFPVLFRDSLFLNGHGHLGHYGIDKDHMAVIDFPAIRIHAYDAQACITVPDWQVYPSGVPVESCIGAADRMVHVTPLGRGIIVQHTRFRKITFYIIGRSQSARPTGHIDHASLPGSLVQAFDAMVYNILQPGQGQVTAADFEKGFHPVLIPLCQLNLLPQP